MGRPLVLIVVALLAAGCATRASYHRLTADVASLRKEVSEIRQAQETTARELSRATAETRALEARLSEVTAAQKSAADEVAALRGRLESTQAEVRDARAKATAAAAPPPAPAAPPPVERPRAAAPRPEGAEAAYKAALATFRAREYGQAVLDFVDFMAKHPKHPLVANAQYWIGEAYYVQKDYRQAMTEFQKVPDIADPKSSKIPDALLKVGLCYRNLREESRARQTWDRVAKDYPRSQAAAKARAFLASKATATRR